MTRTQELAARWSAAVMDTYGVPPLALDRGEGCRVWDVDGTCYLDLLGGIAVSSLGHGHPALVAAVCEQVARLAHTSNLAMHEPGITLAERLVALVGGDARVFLCSSGAEANEAALKLARRRGHLLDATGGRTEVVAAERSFHGRTTGALSLTGTAAKRTPFEPLAPGVTFVPYGDTAALADAVTDATAAVFLEPTLGEGGVVPAPPGYLTAARRLTRDHDALLVLDEVQAGVGRTGRWLAHTAELGPQDRPDVVTLAKGLGGGLPIGACIGLGAAGHVLRPGEHGSTFGGNPVAAAAALAVLDTIEKDGLLEHVTAVGDRLAAGLTSGLADFPLVQGVRGAGLWLAIALTEARGAEVEAAARAQGLLVNAVQPDAVRLAPALVLSAEEADEAVAGLVAAVARVAG